MLLTLKILDYATKSMVFPSIQLLWEKYSVQCQMIKNIFEAGIRVFIHIYLSGYMKCTYMTLSKGVSSIWMELCLLELIYIWQKYLVIQHIWRENLCLITKRYLLVVWFVLIDATVALR
jgi:hypothetical protein